MAFLRNVAIVAAAASQGDMARFRAALAAAAEVPARLAAVRTRSNDHGNQWSAFTGAEQLRTQLVAPNDCRVRSTRGGKESITMTTYASAVVKFCLDGMRAELDAVHATQAQKKAVWRGVAVHMNGLWVNEQLTNRLLETADYDRLKYALDPFTESKQYSGQRDTRSAQRKATPKPSHKAVLERRRSWKPISNVYELAASGALPRGVRERCSRRS